jgi:hypothetical protein
MKEIDQSVKNFLLGDFKRWIEENAAQLDCESERGSAIVSAVLMDEVLENLIKAKLVSSIKKEDELFVGAYAPLGSFSAKIDFAYRLGLISLRNQNSLHIIRQLRNDFAHSSTQETFESTRIKSKIRELFKLNEDILDIFWGVINRRDPEVEKIMKDVTHVKSKRNIDKLVATIGWRNIFDYLVSFLAACLKAGCEDIEPLQPSMDN